MPWYRVDAHAGRGTSRNIPPSAVARTQAPPRRSGGRVEYTTDTTLASSPHASYAHPNPAASRRRVYTPRTERARVEYVALQGKSNLCLKKAVMESCGSWVLTTLEGDRRDVPTRRPTARIAAKESQQNNNYCTYKYMNSLYVFSLHIFIIFALNH